MRFQVLSLVPLLIMSACAPAAETAPPPAAPAPEPPPPAVASAPAPAPAAAPAPSPEELKKAEEQRSSSATSPSSIKKNKAELARITPAIRDAAKSLADKNYPNAKAALTAALASPHRSPESAPRDAQRHPLATLEFLGFKPNQTVLEIGPGEGWYTELLAPSLAKSGKLIVTGGDANGPKDQRPTLYALRTKLFLEKLPEVYSKVETVQVDSKQPKLPFDSKLDMVLIFRGAHGMVNNQLLGTWLAEVHRSLKPNGVLGIEQHRAAAGSNPEEVSKKGYLPEAWLIEQVQAAGFRLAGKSEVNANAKDTRDYPEGVWSLPPTLREGDKDRQKYVAIGESDRMTLKFVKVALPKPKPEAKPAVPAAAAPAPAAKAPRGRSRSGCEGCSARGCSRSGACTHDGSEGTRSGSSSRDACKGSSGGTCSGCKGSSGSDHRSRSHREGSSGSDHRSRSHRKSSSGSRSGGAEDACSSGQVVAPRPTPLDPRGLSADRVRPRRSLDREAGAVVARAYPEATFERATKDVGAAKPRSRCDVIHGRPLLTEQTFCLVESPVGDEGRRRDP